MTGNRACSPAPGLAIGRHRLGQPGLRYCREHGEVRVRLAHGPRRRRGLNATLAEVTGRITVLASALAGLGTVLVSGWYTAAGANAIAQMVAP